MKRQARIWVPATVGNLGPGFDVLGAAVDGPGDIVTVELIDNGPDEVARVTGVHADLIPRDPKHNCSVIAALSLLNKFASPLRVRVSIERNLPVAGGLGSSAAASVGGALGAMIALGVKATEDQLLAAALDGEEAVSGRHLDNIAPALLGGVTLVYGISPPKVARLLVMGEWWLVLVSPQIQLSTKKARHVLPSLVSQQDFVQQMAYTAGLVAAFTSADYNLARETMVDIYAEPRRAPLINGFTDAKAAAKSAGALAASISGAGPSVFALCQDQGTAEKVGKAMVEAFLPLKSEFRVGRVADRGAHAI